MNRPRAHLSLAAVPLASCFVLVCSVLFSGAALAGIRPAVGIFSDVHVAKGEVRRDDVVCIGGTATVEGTVEGNVVVINGRLEFSGEANDVVAIATKARMGAGAVVHGDFVHVLGQLTQDSTARVEGQAVDVGSRLPKNLQRLLSRGLVGLWLAIRIVSLLVSLILVLLIALLVPARVEQMSLALEPRWPASLGFGFLGYVIGIGLIIGLAITIIGIPLAILMGLLLKVLGLMGIAAILLVVGRKVGAGTGLTGTDVSTVAAVLIGFLVAALVRFIPIIGALAWGVLSVLGLGLALVTKLGSPEKAAAAGSAS